MHFFLFAKTAMISNGMGLYSLINKEPTKSL